MINLDENHIDPFIQDEDKLKLEELIPRILMTRKSFLNVTEESLSEELKNPNLQPENIQETTQEEEQDVDLFNKQKFELTKSINSALNETTLSLDFISLLIASVKPNVGKSTMSPHLQKLVKPTSLNSDKLTKDETTTSKSSTRIGQGWKIDSLNKIITMFKDSSISLSEQTNKEHNYWNSINFVVSNNEALFKINEPEKSIGIKYGYGDSGSSYYDDGLGILRILIIPFFFIMEIVGGSLFLLSYTLNDIRDSNMLQTVVYQ
ncbi:unnamed protein product [Candida verbasci]|uniref:Mediator of RNA polymerase II transcription subunit 17 n=1 Tax=Candida verbasci TaxID=1227364 RepID=A0A9W4TV22_9ASCO|nr:unnamed protein product [Candida verbasci]